MDISLSGDQKPWTFRFPGAKSHEEGTVCSATCSPRCRFARPLAPRGGGGEVTARCPPGMLISGGGGCGQQDVPPGCLSSGGGAARTARCSQKPMLGREGGEGVSGPGLIPPHLLLSDSLPLTPPLLYVEVQHHNHAQSMMWCGKHFPGIMIFL